MSTPPDRRPRCPSCGQPVTWVANPARPFCSVACKLVDLGAWLDERYRIAGDPVPADGPSEAPRPPEAG